jgi:hypothetical protein
MGLAMRGGSRSPTPEISPPPFWWIPALPKSPTGGRVSAAHTGRMSTLLARQVSTLVTRRVGALTTGRHSASRAATRHRRGWIRKNQHAGLSGSPSRCEWCRSATHPSHRHAGTSRANVLRTVAFMLTNSHTIHSNSRALSLAALRACARNSARVIGPFCCS